MAYFTFRMSCRVGFLPQCFATPTVNLSPLTFVFPLLFLEIIFILRFLRKLWYSIFYTQAFVFRPARLPLNTGSVRPTQGRTCVVLQVNGGSQSHSDGEGSTVELPEHAKIEIIDRYQIRCWEATAGRFAKI